MNNIVVLEDYELDQFLDAMANARERGSEIYKLRVVFDEASFKFKVNEYMWSPPMGKLEDAITDG